MCSTGPGSLELHPASFPAPPAPNSRQHPLQEAVMHRAQGAAQRSEMAAEEPARAGAKNIGPALGRPLLDTSLPGPASSLAFMLSSSLDFIPAFPLTCTSFSLCHSSSVSWKESLFFLLHLSSLLLLASLCFSLAFLHGLCLYFSRSLFPVRISPIHSFLCLYHDRTRV